MQEPTHILAGVLIQRGFAPGRSRPLALCLTGVAAFLSHGLLDHLANATYHPPNADFKNPFWVGFHSGVLVLTIVFLFMWWRRFKWGIFFACLPDLDWVFIHGQKLIGIKIPWYQTPHLHRLLHYPFDVWPPFAWLHVPSHRFNPLACLYEVDLILALLAVIYFLTQAQAAPKPGT